MAQRTLFERARRSLDRMLHHVATEVALFVLIVISIVLTILEAAQRSPPEALLFAGDVLTGIFVIELGLRFLLARKKRRFFTRYWIDIIAVLPWTRPLRLLRVLRVLRLFRAGVLFRRRMVGILGGPLRQAGTEGLALVLATIALVLLSAVVLMRVEGMGNPEFATFRQSLWYATFSLIGGEPIGGDPSSVVGRFTTLALMLGGMTLFAVFVGTISASMVHRLRGQLEVHELDIDELADHVVVCGWNESGATVLRELFGRGTPWDRAVVLVTEVEIPTEGFPSEFIRPENLYRYIGDYTRETVLEAVRIPYAESVILMADQLVPRSNQDCDARTVLASLTIERMAPDIYTVAELHSRQNEELLKNAGVEDVVVADFYAGMILGSVQRNRGLVRVLDDILTQAHGNAFQTRTLSERWEGRTVGELSHELLHDHRSILMSIETADDVLVNPPATMTLREGQRVMVICADRRKPL
ncbi:MAG: ion transporter [Myxococcota bacterium]